MRHQLIGIEMEYEGVNARAVSLRHWSMKPDHSLRDGIEFITPPISVPRGTRALRELCSAAIAQGWRGGVRCGMHVHFDMTRHQYEGYPVLSILTAYAAFEPVLMSMLPPIREENIYAVPWYRDTTMAWQANTREKLIRVWGRGIDCNRYAALNLGSLSRLNTIEFRSAPAYRTVAHARRWVHALYAMIRWAERMQPSEVAAALYENPNRTVERVFGSLVPSRDWEELLDECDVSGVVDLFVPPPKLATFYMATPGEPDAEPLNLTVDEFARLREVR